MKDVAIIIVNYNVRELLRNCLTTIYASQGSITFDVCVVDNDSDDESVAMVKGEYPQAKLISNLENLGYPTANNQGIRELTDASKNGGHRFVLLLNPDTEMPADGLDNIVAYMDQHPEIGIIGPKLVLPSGELDLACRRSFPTPVISSYRMLGLSRLFPRSKRFGRYNMTYLDENTTAEVDSVVGAFMMVRSSAVAEVGLMDERFWMYGEDLDWAKRVKDAGWKVIYYPRVTVLHIKRASSRQNKRAKLEFYRAMLIFYYKHYYKQTPWPLHWMVLAGIAFKGGPDIIKYMALGPSILE